MNVYGRAARVLLGPERCCSAQIMFWALRRVLVNRRLTSQLYCFGKSRFSQYQKQSLNQRDNPPPSKTGILTSAVERPEGCRLPQAAPGWLDLHGDTANSWAGAG